MWNMIHVSQISSDIKSKVYLWECYAMNNVKLPILYNLAQNISCKFYTERMEPHTVSLMVNVQYESFVTEISTISWAASIGCICFDKNRPEVLPLKNWRPLLMPVHNCCQWLSLMIWSHLSYMEVIIICVCPYNKFICM